MKKIKLSKQQKWKIASLARVSQRTVENWQKAKPELVEVLVQHFENQTKKQKMVSEMTKILIAEKKGVEMGRNPKLNILVEDVDVVWLRDGEEKLLGFENIDQLMKELEGIIKVHKEKWTIKLLDEEKLTEKILFSE